MRSQRHRRVLVLGALGVLSLVGGRVLANGHFDRSVYAAPTAYVETLPTAYVLPTAYILRSPRYVATSYVLSPSYSYVAPTAYYAPIVPTSYELTRGYVPTGFVYPTVYDTPVVSNPCEPCVVPPTCCNQAAYETPAPVKSYPQKPATPPADQPSTARPTPSTVESVPAPAQEPAAPASAANEPTLRRDTSPAPGRPAAGGPVDPNYPTAPEAPANEKEGGAAAAPATVPSTTLTPISPPTGGDPKEAEPKATPPVAPGGDANPVDLPPAGEAETVRHQAQKPVGPAPYVRSVRNGDLHKLQGKVVSTETGRPEEGVTVTLLSRQSNYVDRVVLTDPLGHYQVLLPDGDWTVKVTMPSGRAYPVSQLVVKGGQIHDDRGRDIPSLTINR